MEIPRPLANLITQAKSMSTTSSVSMFSLKATIVTPKTQVVPIGVVTYVVNSDFQEQRADVSSIIVRIQPGVFQDTVLPYKDNLLIELVNTVGLSATSKRYRATPRDDGDNRIQGSHSSVVNMENIDAQNFIEVEFLLLEVGFDAMRNAPVSGSFISTKIDDGLHNLMTSTCQELGLTGADAFKGVDLEKPIDNPKVYRQIMVKQGVRLVNLAQYFQNEEGLGVYSRGLGSFYRSGLWYIYPLVKQGRYGTGKFNVDIIRLPEDVAPSLDETYFKSDKAITILSTGGGDFQDNTDVMRQNHGAGEQVVSPTVISGETGVHYANGRAIKTRVDSMSEFKSYARGSGNERINLKQNPTSNVFPSISASFLRNVTVLEIEWHNSSHFSIVPNSPVKYYYMNEKGTLTVREGCVIAMRSTMQPGSIGAGMKFRSYSTLRIYLFPEDSTGMTPNN